MAPAGDSSTHETRRYASLDLDDAAALEALFPVRKHADFLNHAAVSVLPEPAAQAIRVYAERMVTGRFTAESCYPAVQRVRTLAAELIHARGPHEIAFVPNTSSGLSLVARGLRFHRGDRIVIPGGEYPSNRFPWEDLARRGVELVVVDPGADGVIETDEMAAAINDRTRLVSISAVQYHNGFRADLAALSREVHAARGYLCVDGIQACGVCPIDVQAVGVDFLSADGHKWMLGPEGAGFFYCREDLCEMLHPAAVGWMSVRNALDFGNSTLDLQKDARRFEPGTWNVPGLMGLAASLELLLGVRIERVWERVDALNQRLVEGLHELGCGVVSPRRRVAQRSGIVAFDVWDNGPDADDVVQRLATENVVVAARNGHVRVSPHFYNDASQIDRLLAGLRRLRDG